MARSDQRGVLLRHYRAQGCGVRLSCRDCQLHRDLSLEAVLTRLKDRGVAGERLGIVELAKYVRSPCSRCGGRCFTTAPAFPSIELKPEQLSPGRP